MKLNNPGMKPILLLIFAVAFIGLVVLILSGISYEGGSPNSADNDPEPQASRTPSFTSQPATTLSICTVTVLAPEYTPKHFYPPSIIIYDSRPFFISWTVVNTSEDCTWTTLELKTVVDGELKTLNLMPPSQSQPAIDEEFALWDKNNKPVDQVTPRQRVTITVQIDGLDLVSSNGKIDRAYDMIINGHLAAGGKLIAQQDQWVVLLLPSETPTLTSIPTETATITMTQTLTPAVPPTKTFVFVFPSTTPTPAPPPPRRSTNTPVPIAPSNTPTLALP